MKKLHPQFIVPARAQGQVGAGKIVEFTPRNQRRWIPLPPNARPNDKYDDYEVCGDSLEGIGIYDGFLLSCRTTFNISDVKPKKTVCIILLHATNEQTAKMVDINAEEGLITLIGANPNYKPTPYFFDEVEIIAVVEEVRFPPTFFSR